MWCCTLIRWLECIFLICFFFNSVDNGEPLKLVKQVKMIKPGDSEKRLKTRCYCNNSRDAESLDRDCSDDDRNKSKQYFREKQKSTKCTVIY